jgi:hypothetical protein
VKCWKCKTCVETSAHFLGQWTYTKPQRIRRHDEICHFVSRKVATKGANFQVVGETLVETPSGTLKPGMVVSNQARVQVIDVATHQEDMGYLDEGHNSKIGKFTPLLPILAEQLNIEPGRVLPTVIGTRGAIPKSTITFLHDLNIKDCGSYITLALSGSQKLRQNIPHLQGTRCTNEITPCTSRK